jgi:hypothetical protein
LSGEDRDWEIKRIFERVIRGYSNELIEKPLRIDGVEVTQGIQYYHANSHLTDSVDRGLDNSVRLVANKPAWVRVYVRGTVLLGGVRGEIEVQRLILGSYKKIDILVPEPPGNVTAEINPPYAVERNNINSTLNFIIPSSIMIGSLRLKVKVTNGSNSDRSLVYVDVTLRQTLRLAGIMVGYNGPDGASSPGTPPVNIILAPPNMTDLQTTAALTLGMYPIQSVATYRSAGSVTLTVPLNDAPLPSSPGGCTPNWDTLLNTVLPRARTADGNRTDVVYYGLLPIGIPVGVVVGCGGSGTGAGFIGDEGTMAHEVGHALGLQHAPCGTSGSRVDVNYPAYEPYETSTAKTASIGEYGLDINTGRVRTPTIFKDFMSYCGPGWISVYHHMLLINKPLLDPTIVSGVGDLGDDPSFADPFIISHRFIPIPPRGPFGGGIEPYFEPLISIIGIVHSPTEIEVNSVARIEACRSLPGAEYTEFVAELIDDDNKILISSPLQHLPTYGHDECSCNGNPKEKLAPYHFQAFLTNVASGAALRICRGNEVIWIRRAPNVKSTISEFNARISKPNILSVRFNAKSANLNEQEVWLQWSKDNGRNWHCLSIGLRGKNAKIDISAIPAGPILLRLLVNDGFYTTNSKVVSVKIPPHDPTATILNPRNGTTVVAGSRFRLWGVATDTAGIPISPESITWLIDEKKVAQQLDVFVIAPPEGVHQCTLTVNVNGKIAKKTHTFTSVTVTHDNLEDTESQ